MPPHTIWFVNTIYITYHITSFMIDDEDHSISTVNDREINAPKSV